MKIKLIAETEDEKKVFKEIEYKGVTDYYLDVRWIENKIVQKSESRSGGDLLFLIGRLYSAIVQLKEYWRKNVNTK